MLNFRPQMGEAGPDDVRDYLRSRPFQGAEAKRAPPSTAVRPVPVPPPVSQFDDLAKALEKLLLRPTGMPAESKKEVALPAETSKAAPPVPTAAPSVPSAPSVSTAAPPVPTAASAVPTAAPPVPAGTALHFVCLEDGKFKLTGKYTSAEGTPYAVRVRTKGYKYCLLLHC